MLPKFRPATGGGSGGGYTTIFKVTQNDLNIIFSKETKLFSVKKGTTLKSKPVSRGIQSN